MEEEMAFKGTKLPEKDSFGRRLAIAARAFVARRGAGRTIIAGYPWFLDWGRDSLISARGLLAAGMVSDVAGGLVTFGRFSKNGTMPNTIQGLNASNCDTSDAPLWYGIVCEETAEQMGEKIYATPVDQTGRKVADVLHEIALGYSRGTPNGIRMDTASGLIWSPAHFTWMDTNYPACTPRQGYPVEIQVLWIRLLRQVHKLGLKPASEPWDALANRAEESLRKFFWLEDKGYIADLLIANPGQAAREAVVDQALRSNYLLAIAFGLFTGAQARRGVDAALRCLFVPGRGADAGSPARLAAIGDLQRRRPFAEQSAASRIGAATREMKTPSANLPIITAPPGLGLCRWRAKRWPGRGIGRRPRWRRPELIWGAWINYS